MGIPELLGEIAGHLEDSRDLLHLARADHFTRTVVTPYLFRTICVPLDALASLAVALSGTPSLASHCETLILHCRTWFAGPPDKESLNASLLIIFGAIGQYARLQRFEWAWEGRYNASCSADVWSALAKASLHLQHLTIAPLTEEALTWVGRTLFDLSYIPFKILSAVPDGNGDAPTARVSFNHVLCTRMGVQEATAFFQ